MLLVKTLITAIAAAGGGLLLFRMKVPGGMIIGAVIATVTVNLLTGYTYMPLQAKVAAQICAGAFIAGTIRRDDLRRAARNWKGPLILLTGLLVLNLAMGTVLHAVTHLDKLTCYLCLVPGGLTDIPIIAEELGGNSSVVLTAQFIRVLVGLVSFPLVAAKVARNEALDVSKGLSDEGEQEQKHKLSHFLLTSAIAIAGGLGFRIVGVPAGALVGSLAAVLVWHLLSGNAYMPIVLRRITQCLAGAYIGCSLGIDSLRLLGDSAFELALISSVDALACLVIAWLLYRHSHLSKRASLLAAMPAGASDVALIAADMSVSVPDVVALQLVRMIAVVAVFPQIFVLLVRIGFPFF